MGKRTPQPGSKPRATDAKPVSAVYGFTIHPDSKYVDCEFTSDGKTWSIAESRKEVTVHG